MKENNNENSSWKNRYKKRRYSNKEQKEIFPICPLCGDAVRNLKTAIAFNENSSPAHFDCVIKNIGEKEELQPNEEICYLGNGSFGIIKYKNKNSAKYILRKRIQFEDKDNNLEWRKKVSIKINTKLESKMN